MTRRLNITMPPLHPGQREVLDSPAHFKVIKCGRRWGKSILMGAALFSKALETGGRTWWVWPNFQVSRPGWRVATHLARQIREQCLRQDWSGPPVDIRKTDRTIVLPNGGEVTIKTADDPTKLVAEGLVRVAVDEAGIVQERAWDESILPTLLDSDGDAIIGGVPKGRNWFDERFRWGQDPLEPDWASWQFSTFDNPLLPEASVQRLRDAYERGTIPEAIWRQEYLADTVDDAGTVFRRVMQAATATYQERAIDGHEYAFGVDWGKHNDFTVIAVWDLTLRHLVHMDRFNRIDYTFQVGRLKALAGAFRPVEIIAESNSMGEPLIEQLAALGLPVRPFLTTNATKGAAIEALAIAIERGDVAIVADPHLIGELQAYQMERLPSGLSRYGAPTGLHDDTVMGSAVGHTALTDGGMGMIAL